MKKIRQIAFVLALSILISAAAYSVDDIDVLKSLVLTNNVEKMDELISNGMNVNVKDKDGWTPLIWAVCFSKSETIKFLIEKGADVNAKTNNGKTALSFAEMYQFSDIIKMLKDAGAE